MIDVVTIERGVTHHLVLVDGEPAVVPCGREKNPPYACPVCDRTDQEPRHTATVVAIDRNIGTFTVSSKNGKQQ